MKSWFEIKNMMDGVLNISIHDEIGMWGITATDFMRELNNNKDAKVINLSIHSPGGNLLDGLAIYNSLISHSAQVYASVAGIAGSAASFILMAADKIEMPEDSFIMIHNAQGGAMGDAEYLRDAADVIEKLQNTVVNIYAKRTGLDESKIIEMMGVETWLNASDALEYGFTDTIRGKIGAVAKMTNFNNYFKSAPVEKEQNEIENIKDLEHFLRDSAGVSKTAAMKIISQAKTIFQGDPVNVDAELDEVKAALMRFKTPKTLT